MLTDYIEDVIMSLMSTEQVAEFLGVKAERVKRLARESLLIAKSEDENGEPVKFENGNIPRPSHWGGYIVMPKSIEFWQGRPNRMHDRIRYELKNDMNWKIERLAP